ncbi:MAG TPA: lysophospholipid acyltransferase family protein [bacterium]|nr:lysophospholipid acyltransferase family protein [bacterium]
MDGYAALRWVLRRILRLGFGLEVTGVEHIPADGPAILAVNHRSQIDPVVLAAAVPRRCTFLAAAEVLTMPILGALVRPFRVVPVRRGQFDRGAIEECLARLERGEVLVIFPEGKISTDGRAQPPRDGLAFLAGRAGVPIIPLGIAGTYEVWPLGTRMPRLGRITVRVGEAIVPAEAPARREQSALTARVMEAIGRLSGRTPAASADVTALGLRPGSCGKG